jgi:hypothetical protein
MTMDMTKDVGMKAKITYFDFADLNYASFYLSGFHQNEKRWGYRFAIAKSPPPPLLSQKTVEEWSDVLSSICLFRVSTPDEDFYFCIDTRDSSRADIYQGKGYHLPLLEEVRFYFKANFDSAVIGTDANLRAYSTKIIPVFPFFPIRTPRLLPYLPRITPCAATHWTIRHAAQRCRDLFVIPSLKTITSLRHQKKDLDVFFVVHFYSQERHQEANEFRYRLMKAIQRNRHLNSRVGFEGSDLPSKYRELKQPRLHLREYLADVSRSRVGIYVRGLHDCLSFKFGQLLAMGMPIAGQTIRVNTDGIMDSSHFDIQFAYDEPEQIADRVAELLSRPEELAMLGESNARVFDARFAPRATVDNMLGLLLPREEPPGSVEYSKTDPTRRAVVAIGDRGLND